MKEYKLLSVLIMLTIAACLSANFNYYPKTIVGEYVVSEHDEINIRAYQGLSPITTRYNKGIFIPVRYYHSSVSEEFSSPSVDDYLDSIRELQSGTMIINKYRISNPDLPIESGKPYDYLVDKEYYRPSPIILEVTKEIVGTQLNVEVTATLISDYESVENGTLRLVLIEDNVAEGITNLARKVQDGEFSITQENSLVNTNTFFELDGNWNTDNLQMIVYIINEQEDMIQAASTYEVTTPYLRAVMPGGRIDIGPSEDLFEPDYLYVYYFGPDAEFSIETAIDSAPGDWYLAFCHGGSCYNGPFEFELSDGEALDFSANIYTEGRGMMDYHYVVNSPAFFSSYKIPIRYITDDIDVLIVDGDGWEDYEQYMEGILANSGYSYGTWCTTMAELKEEVNIPKIAWLTGEKEPALSPDDISFLKNHLNNGNSLMISGQHIGSYLADHEYYRDTDFYQNYLNAVLVGTDSDSYELSGVIDDPISSGLNITLNGDESADNQTSPSSIRVNNESLGHQIFHYDNDAVGGIRSINRHLRGSVVYLSFGFEGINDNTVREQLLTNALNWSETTDIEDENIAVPAMQKLKLMPGYPNPFTANQNSHRSAGVLISYNIPANSVDNAELKIYNVRGQLVNRFDELPVFDDDFGYVEWDGNDINGNQAANGIYFYILSNDREQAVRKLSIVR